VGLRISGLCSALAAMAGLRLRFFSDLPARTRPMRRPMARIFLPLLVVALAGCAARHHHQQTNGSNDSDARHQEARIAFPGKTYYFDYVPSSKNFMDDRRQVSALKEGAGTPHSRELAGVLAGGANGVMRVAVSGPNDTLAALTLLDALKQVKGTRFAPLEVAYVGGDANAGELKAAVEALGGTFILVPYPPK
jgi:hypothetical protein